MTRAARHGTHAPPAAVNLASTAQTSPLILQGTSAQSPLSTEGVLNTICQKSSKFTLFTVSKQTLELACFLIFHGTIPPEALQRRLSRVFG